MANISDNNDDYNDIDIIVIVNLNLTLFYYSPLKKEGDLKQ